MAVDIRPAVLADAKEIASVHTRVWHATYGDMAPKEAVQTLTMTRRFADWKQTLASGDLACKTLLAVDQNAVAGFVHYCIKNPQNIAVIKYLYIEKTWQRQGLGQALMRRAFAGISAVGCNAAELSVVDGNTKALEFYKSLGGCVQAKLVCEGHFWRSNNRIIRWNDLKSAIITTKQV